MAVIRRVVDDHTFLCGLDGLYRKIMKRHERGEFLSAARIVAKTLGIGPSADPVEGYYAEDTMLREYFGLMRALQVVDRSAGERIGRLPEFLRLLELTSSPLYGEAIDRGKLFPVGRDALARALGDTFPDWTVEVLARAAQESARVHDEFSLVGLAARAGDAVLLAAFAESTVLYREMLIGAALFPEYVYAWEVTDEIEQSAQRFASALAALLHVDLPPVSEPSAEIYWHAAQDNPMTFRCVRIGEDPDRPDRYYHWAIRPARRDGQGLEVDDFWSPDVWTTERYRPERFVPRSVSVDDGRWIPPTDGSPLPEDPS